MQVKVCPKCKAENKATNAACSSCYTSLENVAVSESAPPARTQAMPAAPRPPSAPARTQQMPAPQQTQMGTMPPPPGMPPGAYQMVPTKRGMPPGIIALIIILAVAILGGGLFFAASQSGLLKGQPMPTDPPEKSVLKFLEAKKTKDLSKVEPYLCQNSRDLINKAFSGRQMESAGFGKKDAEDMYVFGAEPTAKEMEGKEIVASVVKGDDYADDRTAVVSVVVDKKSAPAPTPQPLVPPGATAPQPDQSQEQHVSMSDLFDLGPIQVEYVVVVEDGQWKLDLGQSQKRRLGMGKPGNPFKLGK